MNKKLVFGGSLLGCALASVIAACTLGPQGEPTGSTSEPVTVDNNYVAVPGGYHENSTTWVNAGSGRPAADPHWAMGFNAAGGTQTAGWGVSSDNSATSWTYYFMDSGTQFGNPGNSPYDNSPFSGWRSDPSLAQITNPALNNGSLRLLYTMVALTCSPRSGPRIPPRDTEAHHGSEEQVLGRADRGVHQGDRGGRLGARRRAS